MTDEGCGALTWWARRLKSAQSLATRSRILLASGVGLTTGVVAVCCGQSVHGGRMTAPLPRRRTRPFGGRAAPPGVRPPTPAVRGQGVLSLGPGSFPARVPHHVRIPEKRAHELRRARGHRAEHRGRPGDHFPASQAPGGGVREVLGQDRCPSPGGPQGSASSSA